MEDLHAHIARLEREIEELSESNERSRKIDRAARLSMLGGALWLGAIALGLTYSGNPLTLVAIAALILGLVLYGSNRSTWSQTAERLAAAKAKRSELIDRLDMTRIGNRGTHRLHLVGE